MINFAQLKLFFPSLCKICKLKVSFLPQPSFLQKLPIGFINHEGILQIITIWFSFIHSVPF